MSSTMQISPKKYNKLKAAHEKLSEEKKNLQQEKEKVESENTQLRYMLDWYKRNMFGKKSERFIPDKNQTELPLDVDVKEVSLEKESVSYERTKKPAKEKGHGRGEMPSHLPVKDTIIEPEEDIDEKDYKKIGEEVTWELEFKPGSLYVQRYIRPKYAKKDNSEVKIGNLPARPIEKGNYGPGIMSNITNEKYMFHMPLNRQGQKFKQYFGVKIAESTMVDIIKHTSFWLETVYNVMKKKLLSADYLMADETPVPVMIKLSRKKIKKSYYWVYYDPLRKITLFEYRKGREREGPTEFLKTYKNKILQIDGYSGYNEVVKMNNISRASCMAHVRREFEKALNYDNKRASYALDLIGTWFRVEREAKEQKLTYSDRLEYRIKHELKDSFSEFKKWMIEQVEKDLPSSLIRKACEYAIGQWDYFKPYLENGKVELSNNFVENAIRPVTLGRKNYLFKGSEEGAQRGAIIYSVINTAKQHALKPIEYIKLLLTVLPEEKHKNIDKYLPWNIDLDKFPEMKIMDN